MRLITSSKTLHSALYIGRLRHQRLSPRPHAFSYAVYMVWLDLSELGTVFKGRWFWSTSRPTLAWFRRADFWGDAAIPLDEAVRQKVLAETGRRPAGPIRMLAHLRNYGHCFNPVVFYYCYSSDGARVETIVAEITNTPWKERHAYVLNVDAAQTSGRTLDFGLDKQFHVSPFMPMEQRYRWRFNEPASQLAVHMENFEGAQALFSATLRLRRQDISTASLAAVLLKFPASTARVLVGIYWQALRLKLKGIRVHIHPGPRPGVPLQ